MKLKIVAITQNKMFFHDCTAYHVLQNDHIHLFWMIVFINILFMYIHQIKQAMLKYSFSGRYKQSREIFCVIFMSICLLSGYHGKHPTLSSYYEMKFNYVVANQIKPQLVIHCFLLNSKIENYTFCDFDNATMWYMASV